MLHATVVLYTSCYGSCIEVHIFTIGVVVTHRNGLTLADALTDYSYVNSAMDGVRLARCLTGLGPSGDDNGVLGGLYIEGNMIPNRASCGTGSNLNSIQPRPGGGVTGLISIDQCRGFSADDEGVYTCTMMNSAMMDQLVRFGIYFNGRSESLDLYTYLIT